MASQAWRIEFDRDAARDLRKLGASIRKDILRYLHTRIATTEDPRRFGKALLGELKGLWRYRVGDFRIVAKIEDNRLVVLVVTVGHRREVYD
jgi:mRNA interferase RelE/StbE